MFMPQGETHLKLEYRDERYISFVYGFHKKIRDWQIVENYPIRWQVTIYPPPKMYHNKLCNHHYLQLIKSQVKLLAHKFVNVE